MPPERPPSAHLDPADGLHRARGLGQGGVTRGLPTVLSSGKEEKEREGGRGEEERVYR